MLTTLRAFAWLRLRLLVNAFERTAARDAVERFSLATEKLGPVIAVILLVPSALVLGAGAAVAGYGLATGPDAALLFELVRYTLLAILAFSIVGPIVLPSSDRTNAVRLLLLPIPRPALYVAQAAGAFGDPWLLLALPILAGVPAGLAAGGAIVAAITAVAAGVVLAVAIAGLSTLMSTVIQLVLRDRRRGEVLALIFIVIIPLVAMLPAMIDEDRRPVDGERRRVPLSQRVPAWVGPAVEGAFGLVPTEFYVSAVRRSAGGDPMRSAAPLGGLALAAALLNIAAMAGFRRLLDTPASTATRRTGSMREIWARSLPLLPSGVSAVALGHFRLALRTPRGRAVLLMPLLVFGLFTALMWRGGGAVRYGPFAFGSGLMLATVMSAMAILSILPIAMNQFAVDRAGLTLVMLSPLSTREYLAGKAVGNGLIAAAPVLPIIVISMLLFPGGSPALWVSLPLGLLATFLVVAPVAAFVSAIFPRTVDMNSVGRASNAHSAAGFIGLLAMAAAGLPPILLVLAATRWFEHPALAPPLLLGWIVLMVGVNRGLSRLAERLFTARRENLAMLIR